MAYSLGRAGIVACGEYSSTKAYSQLDLVTYQGGSYIYKYATSASNIAPTNTSYWMKLAQNPTVDSTVSSSGANAVSGTAVTNYVNTAIDTAVNTALGGSY